MKTKKCYGCKKELSLDNFTKNKNTKDGLSYYCRECSKKNYTLNKYKHSNNKKDYEGVVIDELKKHDIVIDGIDIDKIANLRIHLIDMPGVIRPLLKELPAFLIDLPKFCKKYDLSYAEYKVFIEACHDNKIWIKSKPLNSS